MLCSGSCFVPPMPTHHFEPVASPRPPWLRRRQSRADGLLWALIHSSLVLLWKGPGSLHSSHLDLAQDVCLSCPFLSRSCPARSVTPAEELGKEPAFPSLQDMEFPACHKQNKTWKAMWLLSCRFEKGTGRHFYLPCALPQGVDLLCHVRSKAEWMCLQQLGKMFGKEKEKRLGLWWQASLLCNRGSGSFQESTRE